MVGSSRIARMPWFIIIPVLIALALGLWGLSTPGLWYDERVTAETAQYGPFIYPWDATIIPYYVSAWVWTIGGRWNTDAWLRGLSLVATIVAVTCVALAARRLAGRRAGLAAGVLLALLPGVARYSQEARVYALALALAAASTWLFIEAMASNRRGWWLGYSASLLVLTGLAPFALTILVAQTVVLLANQGFRIHWRRALICLIAVLPGLALHLYAVMKVPGQHDWIPEPSLATLLPGLQWPGAMSGGGDWAITSATGVVVCWILAILTPKGWAWMAGTALAVLALWAVSVYLVNFWIVRSALPLAVPLVIGASLALEKVKSWRIVLIAALLGVAAWPQYSAPRQVGGRAEDVKAAALIVDQLGQSGDVVNTKSRGWLEFGVKRYVSGLERFTFSESARGRAWVFSGDAHSVDCPTVRTWQIPGNGLLTLCRSLPHGWSAEFQ